MVEANPESLEQGIKNNEVIQYIIVRTDLGMSKGKIAAQVAHAAVESYKKTFIEGWDSDEYMDVINTWNHTGTKKVVLDGGSLSQFEATLASLDDTVIHHLVVDQGRTEIEPDTPTCVGVGPDFAKKLTPMFKHLELL